MKLWKWFSSLFKKYEDEVVVEPVNDEEEVDDTELEDQCCCDGECDCGCHCDCTTKCNCCKEVTDEADEFFDYVETVDWENLTIENINRLGEFSDLHAVCDDYINWYRISKFKGLPDEFIRKYKDKIIWSEYNKAYLKKVTKQMLKDEGYLN